MIIDTRVHRILGSGVYSDVFEVECKAYKLFKSGPEIPPRQTKEGRRQVFENQCSAYALAQKDSYLRTHVPEFYGTAEVKGVIGHAGESNNESYLLDCCYGMSICEGDAQPITLPRLRENNPHIVEAISRLRRLGINTFDASVFRASDPELFRIVDFELPF